MSEDNNIKEDLNEIKDGAKETVKEFSDGAKEVFDKASGDNKKVMAGILAILLGAFGVHKFVLGYNKEGGILLGVFLLAMVLSCVGVGMLFIWIPGMIGLIEGIIYLTKSDKEFYNTYQVGKKPWF
ncbi:TM2 domain-containing protein [Lacinutrix undariae]